MAGLRRMDRQQEGQMTGTLIGPARLREPEDELLRYEIGRLWLVHMRDGATLISTKDTVALLLPPTINMQGGRNQWA